jgi:hypothetical protein
MTVSTRYVIAKQHKSNGGRQVWGVFDDVSKTFIEGGFFSKHSARYAALHYNMQADAQQLDTTSAKEAK